ncbi:hypothetical protein DRH27_02865 [Candidatus Falkowbacteria bacterium]|nr:MAG: hypothetical protein DRH27_02865 [Candidatus Falkowbacteria bacterium]
MNRIGSKLARQVKGISLEQKIIKAGKNGKWGAKTCFKMFSALFLLIFLWFIYIINMLINLIAFWRFFMYEIN